MADPRSHQRGIGLIEVLLAGTLLILVMLGMNAALLSSSMVAQRSKDITAATSLAQQLLEAERSRCSDPTYYANLPASAQANLSTAINTGDPLLKRYTYTRAASPTSLMTTRDATPGNNIVVKLNGGPIANGIKAGSRVVLYYPPTGDSETIYVVNPNDSANQFLVDDTSPARGRQGLQTRFPSGTLVLTASKLITVTLAYAATNGSSAPAPNRRTLITLSGYVNNPIP